MGILSRLTNSFIFWGAWLIIPLIMEVIPSVGSMFVLFRRKRREKVHPYPKPFLYPDISIIIPVYNSADTLRACIASVAQGTYPVSSIRVFLVNNQGKDNSFSVYAACQEEFSNLHMQWLDAKQGKSRALNLALYNSEGKYIINLDSDGVLEPNALCNLIDKFEAKPDLNCMTGSILTMPYMIKEYKHFFPRLLRELEYVEYAQAFLAGRSYASEFNAVYTLSGAFSAFRKSAILKSRMYNTDTICEDTQLTFQMKYLLKERVEVCERAIFLVDPIEGVNKLYTQRQRWQRGSLEVGKMFMNDRFKIRNMLVDVNVKTLLYDHTFAFPRMIWYLALICMMYMNYSGATIVYANAMIIIMYIIIGFGYFYTSQDFLKCAPELRKYYLEHWWCIFLLPFFNLLVFFIRMAGIVNSIETDSTWKTKNLTEEGTAFVEVLKKDMGAFTNLVIRPFRLLNKSDEAQPQSEFSKKLNKIGWYIVTGACFLWIVVMLLMIFRTTGILGAEAIYQMFVGENVAQTSATVLEVWKMCRLFVYILALNVVVYLITDYWISKKRPNEKNERMQSLVVCGNALFSLGIVLYSNNVYGLLDCYRMGAGIVFGKGWYTAIQQMLNQFFW